MKKLTSIALLSVSFFSFGLVTPLSAGILDYFVGGANDSVIEKHGTRVSRGPDVGNDAIIEKHGTRVSLRSDNTPVRDIITKGDIRTED